MCHMSSVINSWPVDLKLHQDKEAILYKHRELCRYSVMTYMGKESKKRVDICICITDSLCCTAETNATL